MVLMVIGPKLNKIGCTRTFLIFVELTMDLGCIVQYFRPMLSIPHMLTGAFIASKLPHPVLYVPFTLGMHYLQDWIPHWDVGTGLSKGTRKKTTAILLEIIDLFISIGLVYWFFRSASPDNQVHIWLGALTGILPDLIESPRNFLKWEPFFLKPINKFHGLFHHSTPQMIFGLIPQVIVVIAIWLLR
jgi:hypothetical protein